MVGAELGDGARGRGGGGVGAEPVDHLVEPLDEGAGQVLRLRRRDVRRYHCNDNSMCVAGPEMIMKQVQVLVSFLNYLWFKT